MKLKIERMDWRHRKLKKRAVGSYLSDKNSSGKFQISIMKRKTIFKGRCIQKIV